MSSHRAGEQESGYESKQEYEKKMPVFRLSMFVPFLCFIRFLLYFRFSFPQALIQPVIDMSILYNKIRVKETGAPELLQMKDRKRPFRKAVLPCQS